MIALAMTVLVLGAQALAVVAAIVSAARAHLAWALLASGAVGVLVAVQIALVRIEPWALGASFACALGGIGSIHLVARGAANADVERETKAKTGALVGLACIQAAVIAALVFGHLLTEP